MTNRQRAAWADEAIEAFIIETNMNGEDELTIVGDLLCDLHHWCDLNGVDWNAAINHGMYHYEHEARFGPDEETD